MPQEFQVVQCYNCQTFQVHQVKKTTKWACKMCGEKQSLKKVFGRGTGADCRQHVQRLNTVRGEMDQQKLDTDIHCPVKADIDPGMPVNDQIYADTRSCYETRTKWIAFVESDQVDDNDDGDDRDDDRYTTDAQMFEQSRKRKRESKGGNYSRTRNADWSNSSNVTGVSSADSFSNCAGEDGIGSKGIYRPHSLEDFSFRPRSAGFENESEKYAEDSSLGRSKWSTYDEPDETSSQESISRNYGDDLTKRVKYASYTSKSEIRQRNISSDKNYTSKGTKWGTFTENEASSQDDCDNSFQESDDAAYDARPYVSFDTKMINSSNIDTGSYRENEEVSHFEAENSKSYYCNEGNNDVRGSVGINSKQNTSQSKWAGLLSSTGAQNQSGEEPSVTPNVEPEVNSEKQPGSKWDMYFNANFNVDRKKSDPSIGFSNDHMDVTVRKCENNTAGNQQEKVSSSEESRFLRNIGNQFNVDSSRYTEKKLLFSTGDLDDTDFEL